MDKNLEILKDRITGPMQEMDIIVDSITFLVEGKYKFLRIELDKVNGLDLDTIVEATNIINPIVDEMDFVDDSFILDVISKEKGSVENE